MHHKLTPNVVLALSALEHGFAALSDAACFVGAPAMTPLMRRITYSEVTVSTQCCNVLDNLATYVVVSRRASLSPSL